MSTNPKKSGRFEKGNPGKPKGAVTKSSALIREMVAQALDKTGGIEYLMRVSDSHPAAFLALVGKVIPVQLQNADDQPFRTLTRIELVPMAGNDTQD